MSTGRRALVLAAFLALVSACGEQADTPISPEQDNQLYPVTAENLFKPAVFAPVLKSHIPPPPGSVTIIDLAGDMDNFGYGLGNYVPCAFYNLTGPGDLGIFDRELTGPGDAVESWTHDFTGDPNWSPGFEALVVMLEVPELFSDFVRSDINIDGNLVSFTPNGFSRCGPAIVQEFTFTGAAAAFANDGIVNVTFRENGDHIALDYARLTIYGRGEIIVDLDIKPGSSSNPINPKSKGVIPVAVLSDGDFDATTIDATTVVFGPGGASEAHGTGHVEDVDGDGDLDMVFHFSTQDSGLSCGDTEAELTGKTTAGRDIRGTDVVSVKCK